MSDEVSSRKVLLFNDFTVIVISELYNKELLGALKDVTGIRIDGNVTQLRKSDKDDWIKSDTLEDLLKPVLQANATSRLAVSDLPLHVKGDYVLASVVSVEIVAP